MEYTYSQLNSTHNSRGVNANILKIRIYKIELIQKIFIASNRTD